VTAQATPAHASSAPAPGRRLPEFRHQVINALRDHYPDLPHRIWSRAAQWFTLIPLRKGESRVYTHEEIADAFKVKRRTSQAYASDLAQFGLLGVIPQFGRRYRATFPPRDPRKTQRGNRYYLKFPERLLALLGEPTATEGEGELVESYLQRAAEAGVDTGGAASPSPDAERDRSRPAPARRPRGATAPTTPAAGEPHDRPADDASPGAPAPSASPSPSSSSSNPPRASSAPSPSTGSTDDPAAAPPGAPSPPPGPVQRHEAAIARLAAQRAAVAQREAVIAAALAQAEEAALEPDEREILVELALASRTCPGLVDLAIPETAATIASDARVANKDLVPVLKAIRDLARKGKSESSQTLEAWLPGYIAPPKALEVPAENVLAARLELWRELTSYQFTGRLLDHARARGLDLPALLAALRAALADAGTASGDALRRHVMNAIRGPRAAAPAEPTRPRPVQTTNAFAQFVPVSAGGVTLQQGDNWRPASVRQMEENARKRAEEARAREQQRLDDELCGESTATSEQGLEAAADEAEGTSAEEIEEIAAARAELLALTGTSGSGPPE
jgi:hypothetical protein